MAPANAAGVTLAHNTRGCIAQCIDKGDETGIVPVDAQLVSSGKGPGPF